MREHSCPFINGKPAEQDAFDRLKAAFPGSFAAFETCLAIDRRIPLAKFHQHRMQSCLEAHGISINMLIWESCAPESIPFEQVRLSYGHAGGNLWWRWEYLPLAADPRVYAPQMFRRVQVSGVLPVWKYLDRTIYTIAEYGVTGITLIENRFGPLEGTRHALVAIQDTTLYVLPEGNRLRSVGEAALCDMWQRSGNKVQIVSSMLPYERYWFVVNALRGLAPLEGSFSGSGVGIASEMWNY